MAINNPYADPNYDGTNNSAANPYADPDYDGGQSAPKSGTIRRALGDTGVSLLKGAIGVPETVVGIADLVSGGQAGKLAESAGFKPKEAKAIISDYYSPEQKLANQKVQEADGFVNTIQAALQNPSTIVQTTAESLPVMGLGGVASRRLLTVAPKVAPFIAGAAGEGLVTAGQNAEQTRQETADGLLTGKQAAIQAGSGLLTGAISGVSGNIAQKLGIADIETMLAQGKLSPAQLATGLPKAIAGGVVTEGLLEEMPQSAQEQIAQNLSLDKPWDEGVGNAAAMGALSGGLMGGGANALNAFGGKDNTQVTPPPAPPAPEGSLTSAATIAQAVGLTQQPVTPDVTAEAKPNIVDSLNAVEAQQAQDISPVEMPVTTLAPEQAAEKQIIDEQAQQAATSPLNDLPQPTEKQVEAGNYKKGHIKYDGLNITVENPQGSTRSGTDEDGNAWENTLQNHYGYIKRTKGNDGDNLDVFVGDKPANGKVFVINQTKKDGSFDEHKAVLGAETADEAIAIYKANYADDWNGGKSVTELTTPAFKDWLKNGDPTKPLETVSATSNDVDMTKVAVGEQVDVGGVPYVKTENGFERVSSATNVDTTITPQQRVDETANGVQEPAGYWQSTAEKHNQEFKQSNDEQGSSLAFLAGGNLSKGAKSKLTAWQNKKGVAAGKAQVSNLGAKFEQGEAVDAESIISAARLNLPKDDTLDTKVNSAIDLAIISRKLLETVNKPQARKVDFNIKTNRGEVFKITAAQIDNYLKPAEVAQVAEVATPATESAQPTDTVRPLVEQLTKLRATADKHPSFDPALKAAKDFMAGKKVSPKQFKNFANLLGKKNKAFSEVLMQLHDQAASTPEQLAAKEKKSKLAKAMLAERMKLDTTKDGLMQAMAKLGGLNAEKAKSEFGIDPADMRQHGAGIKRSFNKNGLDADTMRELLLEQGYPVGESVADLGNAIADAMSGIDVLTPAGQEALAQKKYEEYANAIDELSDDEQALLDELVTKATAKYGAEALAEIDASLAESMKGQPQPEIERALLRMLKEEFDDETGNAGNSQATEGQAGQDTESGSTENGSGRAQQDGASIEGQGSETSQDLLGDNTAAKQALADAERAKDAKRNSGTDNQDTFTLSGSNSEYEQARAAGAQDLIEASQAKTPAEETGVDDKELKKIVSEFDKYQQSMLEDDYQVHHLFDKPAKNEIVRLQDKAKVYHKDHGWMTVEQAKAKIAEWKDHAAGQYEDQKIRNANNQKVVLSLFDLTGSWSKPWEEAGYQVYRFDIQDEIMDEIDGETININDINNFSSQLFNDYFGGFEGNDIYAILAATPCTDFASSGARHFAAKDADGRTAESVKLVHMTLATIEYFKPSVWAIENPVGRIEKLGSLPPWRLSFDPNHLGDPYTKKTLLWGRFNGDLPVAPVEPTEGSKMHTLYGGKSLKTKNARSATPEGFSYGFFMANNAADHPEMAIANKYDRLDRDLITKAIKAGITEAQIDEAVEDYYYMDMDDDAANEAIQELITGENEDDNADEDTQPAFTLESPAEQPKPETKTATVALKDTSDVGIEMLGNRRNKGLTLKDIQDANNDTERVAMAVKTKLWERPDYQELVDSGVQPAIAHIVKQIYDGLSSKPAYKGEKMLYDYVDVVEATKKAVDEFLSDKQAMARMITAVAVKAKKQSWMLNSNEVIDIANIGNENNTEIENALDYFVDRIFPKNESGARWGRQNKEGNDKANATGNRFYKNIQLNLSSFIDAMKAVQQGFPAKQEAWQRSYQIKEADGKFQVIKKGRYSPKSEHATREEAEDAARALVKREKEEAFKEPETPVEKSIRKGRELRANGNVSSQELQDAVGLKAVNFGDWMKKPSNAKERQSHVNSAFDAFHDLAEVLNLPVNAMSLDGMLGLAIGAQGKGKAAAHFYPGYNEINLTREKGAGSLAHEWAHGLDHYFGVQAGLATSENPFASWNGRYRAASESDIRPEVADAFNTIVESMRSIQETPEAAKERITATAQASKERIEQYIERNGLKEAVKDDETAQKALNEIIAGETGDYVEWPALKGKRKPQGYISEYVKYIADKLGWNFDRAHDFHLTLAGHSASQEALKTEPTLRKIHTDYYRSASVMDGSKVKAYWSTPHELFARAFEMYVAEKIANADGRNDYLVAAWKQAEEINTGDKLIDDVLNEAKKRYPQGKEREAINAAFDVLFNEIKTKETDKGITLYSRASIDTYAKHSIDPENVPVGKWAGRVLFHGTSDTGADSIHSDGVQIEKSEGGYFGKAFYAASDAQLAANNYADAADDEGSVIAFKVKDNANILDLRSEKDWETYQRVTKNTYVGNPDFDKVMVRNGIDGLFDRSFGGLAIYNPKAIEILPDEPVKYSRPAAPTFYSALAKAIPLAKQDTMPAGQWKNWLVANAGKMNVKQAELQWSGLTDWLELQTGKVSKADIQQYLDANGVQVTETMLGNANDIDITEPDTIPADLQALLDEYENGDYQLKALVTKAKKIGYELNVGMDGEVDDITRIGSANEPTKYGKYTVAGGENYKELLLTLPRKKFIPKQYTYEEGLQQLKLFKNPIVVMKDGVFVKNLTEPQQLESVKSDFEKSGMTLHQYYFGAGTMAGGKDYQSSHFEQPNILAHVRFDERVDADGNKVLFINEIQSDFGQEFKKAKDAISKAVDDDFNGIVERMKAAGVLEVNCD